MKTEYFNAIKAGLKLEEFRLRNAYWKKRLVGKTFGCVVVMAGYPAAGDAERRLVLPWQGVRETTIQHPHFGSEPVDVFAIATRVPAGERGMA